ncbi:TPA: DUF6414 family protein [Staphylococcus pseudintermedius]
MKDFLYLDTDSISSISAQLFEGNILEIIDEKTEQKGENIRDSYGTHDNRSSTAKLGVSGTNVGGTAESGKYEDKNIEFLNNETFKMGVKKAYDDFLYNKVFDRLKLENEIHSIDKSNQFDFVDIEGRYSVTDLHTSSKIFDTDLLRQMPFIDERYELPSIESLKSKFNSAQKYIENPGSKKLPKQFQNFEDLLDFYDTFKGLSMMKTFNEMNKHLNEALHNKIVLNKGNTILIGDRKNLRIPGETISLAKEIELRGFGRKITNNEKVSTVIDFQKTMNAKDFLSRGTQGMLMVFLRAILDLNDEDTFDIIQPIGLEFSKVSR